MDKNKTALLKYQANQFAYKTFVAVIEHELTTQTKHTNHSIEKIALTYGIEDKTVIKELTELAIANKARAIAHLPHTSERAKFQLIVQLYHNQVNLNHRTSHSILLQQYSTPAPICYLAGLFCELDKLEIEGGYAFEPSAGNGLMTIAGNTKNIYVNEIDFLRNRNLKTNDYADVYQTDATTPFTHFYKRFNAVLTNPPFGRLPEPINLNGYSIKPLEHLMAIRALDTMKDNGRCAIIIGGHTQWDKKKRIQSGRNRVFFNYLYHYYNVVDVLQINGSTLFSRQGTSFNVRLILIDGRKRIPDGASPLKNNATDIVIHTFDQLYERIIPHIPRKQNIMKQQHKLSKEEIATLIRMMREEQDGLGKIYTPASDACIKLDTQVPDSMSYETEQALIHIEKEVGGDIDNFVRDRLGYYTKAQLCNAFSAEQIDAIALAIYNIEAKNQGMIIGDQTGIGKGRVAAAMIRYGVQQGLQPIFITEKANLFSDIYRDLLAIGSEHLVPFIINAQESKTAIKDEEGIVVYQAPSFAEQQKIFEQRELPTNYNYVCATYSQFNSAEKKPTKPNFLKAIAKDNILIMDESHNASGSSNTGEFLQNVVFNAKGVTFLSATFAKQPNNMPLYAMKTAIQDCNLSKDALIYGIIKGGVALQEVLSAQLVEAGQMIRRERSFEGVEINYIDLVEKEQEHKAIADNITEVLREIIAFQNKYVDSMVSDMDDMVAEKGLEVKIKEGTKNAGVDNISYFSKVFHVINQMLFAIKAESVAERAIMRLQEGKKPVIAFSSTMGSFVEQLLQNADGDIKDEVVIKADFSEVLKRGLQSIRQYTVYESNGEPSHHQFDLSEFSEMGKAEYQRIENKINTITTGISLSPIDIIIQRIKEAGYSVAEVTGRKYEIQINTKTQMGKVTLRKKINTNDAFRLFNNNEVDVLLINQSGSTGASAHAIPTSKVPKEKVKQRVLLILQPEFDINKEVQKRGRINRTGQIYLPIYDYMISAIPAEKRLMMMLQKKLKSLDANTTSNQKQSTTVFDVPDFLNKYGNKVVQDYLMENNDINALLDYPLKNLADDENREYTNNDISSLTSGRVAVLNTTMQNAFYTEITARYNDYINYLQQVGDYDLEMEAMNLQTETVDTKVVIVGKNAGSSFGDNSVLETVKANVLKKPFTSTELENLLQENLQQKSPEAMVQDAVNQYTLFINQYVINEIKEVEKKYDDLIQNVPSEKKIMHLAENEVEYNNAILTRLSELKDERTKQIDTINKTIATRKSFIIRMFNFFKVGRNVNFPMSTFDEGEHTVMGVFLGFMIDEKIKNPYAPSAIKLRFALANSKKYIVIPASYTKDINAIIGASSDIKELETKILLQQWNEHTKANRIDRTIRYIITGNLLQAFSRFKGKLVSYTTIDEKIKKGILMPESWTPEKVNVLDKITVPILSALSLFQSLAVGKSQTINEVITLIRKEDCYKIIVPLSRSLGGSIYLDADILNLVENNQFEKTSDKMTAELAENKIESFIQLLQDKFSYSVDIANENSNLISTAKQKQKLFSITLPGEEKAGFLDAAKKAKIRALKLKLLLELELQKTNR